MSLWSARAARSRLLADRYPACREILLFYAGLAAWQGSVAGRSVSPHTVLDGLVELVTRTGSPLLRETARSLRLLPHLHSPPPLDFFGRAARQPFAAGGPCPWCNTAPQAGCLVTQEHGMALELVCGLCFSRRPFPRLRCPACGRSKEGRLVSYSAPELSHLLVQACEDCRAYLLLVDLARDPEALPEVDELAGLPLDLWAQEQGYFKIRRNLAGV